MDREEDVMVSFLVLACPTCELGQPDGHTVAAAIGTVPVAFLLLRPYTRDVELWGRPRIRCARVVSLLMLLAFSLIPLWQHTYGEKPLWLGIAGLAGVAV